ncbi:MAG TPA: alpha/beta hydrolase [Gammaproteobacteria bacterium]|nr:alpha/beta hydrolase [Gammaproteobacteria bacterium]
MQSPLRTNESSVDISGPVGKLEGIFADNNPDKVAIICHPDPQQQGTMNNKVVTTLARSYEHKGISTLRFNYRGVGNSEGQYGHVQGEIQDGKAALTWLKNKGFTTFYLAGFSFGSYIATALNQEVEAKSLLIVAPPVKRFDFSSIWPDATPAYIFQGEKDDVVMCQDVLMFVQQHPRIYCHIFHGTGHFFHGKLPLLQHQILSLLS